MLSNVHSHYRKVTQGTICNQEKFCIFVSPAFIKSVSAALLLLETVVTVTVWVKIQLEAFLTPLLATVLQLIEHFIQCLTK